MATRRNFLALNLMGAASWAVTGKTPFFEMQAEAAASGTAAEIEIPRDFWRDWPNFISREVTRARAKRLASLAEIRSIPQAQRRAEMVRSTLWELIGGRPEKTPLRPRITHSLNRDGYRIENLIYESFPEFYVTANLYLPTSGKPPFPAVLAPLGHAFEGKAFRNYQYLYQNLARKGYVVLAYDVLGEGERVQYIDPVTGGSRYGPTGEHFQAGKPMILFGDNFARCCVWDAIRGLDYLVSRPEVDAGRIGCTGHSGGGTMTMYLAALEPRIQVAVEIDGNSENVAGPLYEPPGAVDDAEQNIVGSLPFTLDRGDLLWTFAPKPLLMCYTTHDQGEVYSPVYEEATTEVYHQLQRVYGLYGATKRVDIFASFLPHDMDFFCRTQTYAWFNRWLGNTKENSEESKFDPVPVELLNVTRTGQVLTSLGGRSIVQLNSERMNAFLEQSSLEKKGNDAATVTKEIRTELSRLLALPKKGSPLESKISASNPRKDILLEEFEFQSQPGVRIPGWFARPVSKKICPTVLYLDVNGGDGIVGEPGSMDQVIDAGYAVCAITLRGLGISRPSFPSEGPNYYACYFPMGERYAWMCMVLGLPAIGQWCWDTMRAIDYLATRPDVDASQIRILGMGSAGLAAQMATLFDERPRSILLDRTPTSYKSIVQSQTYSLDLAWFTPNILRKFDLPNIAIALSPRQCWLLNGVDPDGKVLSEAELRQPYDQIERQTALPLENMRFMVTSDKDPQNAYLKWLKST